MQKVPLSVIGANDAGPKSLSVDKSGKLLRDERVSVSPVPDGMAGKVSLPYPDFLS